MTKSQGKASLGLSRVFGLGDFRCLWVGIGYLGTWYLGDRRAQALPSAVRRTLRTRRELRIVVEVSLDPSCSGQ
jgi:hypothetical protein